MVVGGGVHAEAGGEGGVFGGRAEPGGEIWPKRRPDRLPAERRSELPGAGQAGIRGRRGGVFLSSGSCVFDASSVDRRLREAPEPLASRDGGTLLVWFPPAAGRRYLVAVDPAGGGSEGDYSAAQVIEMGSGLQCAELQAKLGTLELAQRAAALGREYGTATLVVERNNHGSGVLAYLKSVCHYPAIYSQTGQAGWLTSSLSRPETIGGLGAALVESAGIFQSRRLLKECRTFVRLKNGRTGAQPGAHDDCVMAMAIALAARAELAGRDGTPRAGREI